MIKRESSIDFLQLCLLRLPLLNMDSVQLPFWLCLEIDTLFLKCYSFFDRALCQGRDRPDSQRLHIWFASGAAHQWHSGTQVKPHQEQWQKGRTEPMVGSVGCCPKQDNGCTNTFIESINALCPCVLVSTQAPVAKVMKIIVIVSAPPPKTRFKNKHTRPSTWRRLIFVKLCYGTVPTPHWLGRCVLVSWPFLSYCNSKTFLWT